MKNTLLRRKNLSRVFLSKGEGSAGMSSLSWCFPSKCIQSVVRLLAAQFKGGFCQYRVEARSAASSVQ